jgi:hypothetical protein
MRKIILVGLILLSGTNLFAWNSETGGSVVSSQENIVRASLEATQVLQSDTRSNLYGTTILGGTVNNASFDSGGVLSFRNVVSSSNKALFSNGDYLAWLTSTGDTQRIGVTTADYLSLPRTSVSGILSADGITVTSFNATTINLVNLDISGDLSADNVHVDSDLDVSGDSSFVGIRGSTLVLSSDISASTVRASGNLIVSGQTVMTGVSATNVTATGATVTNGTITNLNSTTANLTTANATTLNSTTANATTANVNQLNVSRTSFASAAVIVDNDGKIIYQNNRPKRTIFLSAGGASAIGAGQSADTMGLGGTSPIFKQNRLVFSPFADQEAQWNFEIPDSYTGTSLTGNVVWYIKDRETRNVSYEVATARVADSVSFDNVTFGQATGIQDVSTTSGQLMVTSSFSIPTSWVSGDNGIVRLKRVPLNAGDTISHDVNVIGLRMEYEVQTESD